MNRDTGSSMMGSLLADLRDEGTNLLRQEVALAKAELSEKATQAGMSALRLATGGAVAYAGGIVLLMGAGRLVEQGLVAAGLSPAVAQWLGFVLVGALVALVGWLMLAKARKSLKAESLVPRQTINSLKENRQWAENKIHAAHEPAP